MRTTVTLEPDVAAQLKAIASERGISFKAALNAALRDGLAGGRRAKPYRTPTRPLALRPGIDLDRALRLAAELEDDELIRKLELRK